MTKNNKHKLFHDVMNVVISIKMGIEMLKAKSETKKFDKTLVKQIDQAIIKLNNKWSEIKEIASL